MAFLMSCARKILKPGGEQFGDIFECGLTVVLVLELPSDFYPLGHLLSLFRVYNPEDRLLCSTQRVKVDLRLNKSLRNNLFPFHHLSI
jgi:hypothetical protein